MEDRQMAKKTHENIDDFDVIYERILESTCTENQKKLSEALGISQSAISDAKRKRAISSEILILVFDKFNISPNYIRYGLAVEKEN